MELTIDIDICPVMEYFEILPEQDDYVQESRKLPGSVNSNWWLTGLSCCRMLLTTHKGE